MQEFNPEELDNLYAPPVDSSGEDNGQVTIIGGSDLFHGAPLLALRTASKIVDMVFFSSPEKYMRDVSAYLKSEVASFIWVPWEEVDNYIEKSDAVLIGPGFKRYASENNPTSPTATLGAHQLDQAGAKTKQITEELISKHKDKKWVIDAGSLQVIDAKAIPENAIITPNTKEYEMLFGEQSVEEASKKHNCTIVLKGPETRVCSKGSCYVVKGGNAGLTKGGTGDVLAGLTTALYAKNDAILAANAASFVVKKSAEDLAEDVGVYFSADDLSRQIPATLNILTAKL